MKKTYLIIGCLMATLTLFGQGTELIETLVESPKFGETSKAVKAPVVTAQVKPIYEFIQNNIIYPSAAEPIIDEGVVVVNFVVEPTGKLSNYEIENSVSYEVDNCVINCLKLTSGRWLAGKVNGNPTAMTSKVYVRFDIPDNNSLENIARMYMKYAIKQYDKGVAIATNTPSKIKASNRHYNYALGYLAKAEKFRPDEFSIKVWESKAYEKLGDINNRNIKIREMNELLSEYNANGEIEMAEIIMRVK